VTYHVEISPQAEQDIKAIGAYMRRFMARAVRSFLGDPSANSQHFQVVGQWRGIVIGNVVAIFRFMQPDELEGVGVPGRYVGRVVRQDELEEATAELRIEVRPAPSIQAAAEDLRRALREALRRRGF
jgi:hypothetical protein